MQCGCEEAGYKEMTRVGLIEGRYDKITRLRLWVERWMEKVIATVGLLRHWLFTTLMKKTWQRRDGKGAVLLLSRSQGMLSSGAVMLVVATRSSGLWALAPRVKGETEQLR